MEWEAHSPIHSLCRSYTCICGHAFWKHKRFWSRFPDTIFDPIHCRTYQEHREGGVNLCVQSLLLFQLYNQQLIQYYALSHYHYMTISIIISSSSHRKHSNTVHKIFTWKPKYWGENHGSLFKIVFQK